MELKKAWQQVGDAFFLRDVSTEIPLLQKGIYVLDITDKGELFLRQTGNEFKFDFKIYGLERPFIDKAIKAYKNTNTNFGVLLNGIKGTGKTVTAEILANELDNPIILINAPYRGANTYLTSIQQDITILIDEYEKVYKGNMGDGGYEDDEEAVRNGDSSLLSLMDGTFKTQFRKCFILTTNRTWVNENMLNRPGRIRYLKNFGDLNLEQITEIIDDCLEYKEYKEDIINFLKPLRIITVDIVKSIVSEVNIFNEPPAVCCKDFNIEFKEECFNVVRLASGKQKKDVILEEEVSSQYINAFITSVKRRWNGTNLATGSLYLASVAEPDLEKNVFTVYDVNYGNKADTFKIRFDRVKNHHKSFLVF